MRVRWRFAAAAAASCWLLLLVLMPSDAAVVDVAAAAAAAAVDDAVDARTIESVLSYTRNRALHAYIHNIHQQHAHTHTYTNIFSKYTLARVGPSGGGWV